MQITATELSKLLNGTIEGNPNITVNRPSKIEEGGEGTITFLANPKYAEYAYTTTASILLVGKDFKATQPIAATLIRVENVYESLAFLLNQFGATQGQKAKGVIDKSASIDSAAIIGQDVSVGKFSIIEKGCKIGESTIIYPQVHIAENVTLGKNCKIYPGVKIYHGCEIGDNCILHANVVIGEDGFGFAPKEDGTFEKISQIGNVVIESNVEIGSNTTIDRGSIGSTTIKKGVKIDNLVQIAHNVSIGENTVIASQAGIAGSTKIGKNCMIGGQVGFAGHLTIADGSKFQAQSGIGSNIKEPNKAYFGSPIMDYKDYIRSYGVFKKLPEIYRSLGRIEKEMNKFKE